jgi:hypothetical protein
MARGHLDLIRGSLVDKYRKRVGMQMAENTVLINDFSLSQTWATFNFASERMVSWHQLQMQGEDLRRGRTKDEFFVRTLTRGALAGGLLALPAAATLATAPGAASAVGWAVSLCSVAGSLRKRANQKVIESPGQAFRHLRKGA